MKEVRCKFKGLSKQGEAMLKGENYLLLISVGQQSHEGDRFAATVDLINRSSFKSCTISLYDSLQRYTMALGGNHTPLSLYDLAHKEGDLWLERNTKYIDQLEGLKTIYRWDHWLNHQNFTDAKKNVLDLISEDESYAHTFDIAVDNYLNRYMKNELSSGLDLERAKAICHDYIVEECAVLCLWPELQCKFEIYPNPHNDAIIATKERFIKSQDDNMLIHLPLKFINASLLAPQYFHTFSNKENKQPREVICENSMLV